MPFIDFPFTPTSPAPGARHRTMEEAFEVAAEDGTRSILDIMSVAEVPDFCVAAPLPREILDDLYGTTQPSLAAVEENMDFLEEIERGHCVYVVCYANGQPSTIVFAGYSFD